MFSSPSGKKKCSLQHPLFSKYFQNICFPQYYFLYKNRLVNIIAINSRSKTDLSNRFSNSQEGVEKQNIQKESSGDHPSHSAGISSSSSRKQVNHKRASGRCFTPQSVRVSNYTPLKRGRAVENKWLKSKMTLFQEMMTKTEEKKSVGKQGN